MPMQNAEIIKDRIISLIQARGPCLPIHISKGVNMSIIFSSAFLSELLNEKRLKMSHMRVGSSPVYYLEDQEAQLEMYSEHLKGKEKEAFNLLKEKKFLEDSTQQPAIRVALRAIKDFAKPFNPKGKTIWRFFTIPESEFEKEYKIKEQEIPKPEEIIQNIEEKIEEVKNIITEDTPEESPKDKKLKKPKAKSKPKTKKQDDKFFNRVKEFLNEKGIELLDIEDFSKSEIVLRVKENKKEILIIAFNKKKLMDKDLINAYKRASKSEIPYQIISLGETPKKLADLIEASKALQNLEKIE